MNYIVRSDDVYVTVEPTLDKQAVADGKDYCITFAWTLSKGEAVRFASRWHAKAVARALVKAGKTSCVIELRS